MFRGTLTWFGQSWTTSFISSCTRRVTKHVKEEARLHIPRLEILANAAAFDCRECRGLSITSRHASCRRKHAPISAATIKHPHILILSANKQFDCNILGWQLPYKLWKTLYNTSRHKLDLPSRYGWH